jgi:hypothetical protein
MKTLDWSVETLGPEYNSSAWALYSFIETDYLYFYYFLMQVNKLIEENKKELDYLLNEMNLSEYRGWKSGLPKLQHVGNVCIHISRSERMGYHARRLAQQVSLVCGRLQV